MRNYLHKVVPELKDLGKLREVAQTTAIQNAENQMKNYLDEGPGKYKEYFTPEYRKTLEEAYRANGYQATQSIKALEGSIQTMMKEKIASDKAAGVNRRNVGQSGSGYAAGAPVEVAAKTDKGKFDWEKTSENIARVQRGG